MEQATYRCKQSELYTICNNGWNSCRKYQEKFEAFKTRYTNAYIDERIAEILAAEKKPNEQARGGKPESLHNHLKEQATLCLTKWQYLKRYIISAKDFKGNQQKPALETAGQNHYLEASQDNWEILRALLIAGSNFITNNLAALTANNNMPPTFPAIFTAEKDKFLTLHIDFLASEETEVEETQSKIALNNQIYDQLMEMFLDGQLIFKDEDAIRKRFTFVNVLFLVRGAGTSGIRGIITHAQTNQAIRNVTVTITPKNRTTITNTKGNYSILQVGQGSYNITFQKAGYQTHTLTDFEIKIGTTAKINVQLSPL